MELIKAKTRTPQNTCTRLILGAKNALVLIYALFRNSRIRAVVTSIPCVLVPLWEPPQSRHSSRRSDDPGREKTAKR